MNYSCPQCNSENTQRLDIAYKTGVRSVSGSTSNIGVGTSSSGLGIGASEGNFVSTQKSLFSSSIQPPEKKSAGCITGIGVFILIPFIIVFLGMGIGGNFEQFMFTLTGVLIGIGIIWVDRLQRNRFNRDEYEPNNRIYQNKFICLRCGNIFQP